MARVSRDLFVFLAELSRHNNREWFNANKDRYLAEVRDPMLAFIASIAAPLNRISRHIVNDPRAWKVAKRGGLTHDEATLKRPPRGFDPDHPLIDDLKRLSFTSGARFSERQACAPDFPTRFVAACRREAP